MVLVVVTMMSLALAVAMSIVAWRLARAERRRSNARVAALSEEIHRDRDPLPTIANTASALATSTPLFSTSAADESARPRYGAAFALGVFAIGVLAALILVAGGPRRITATSARHPSIAVGTAPAAVHETATPLELVALAHERDGDRLIVRGVVRNPRTGMEIDGLTALVFLFDHEGAFIVSGRAAVAQPTLGAGADTPFLVNIPGANNVDRYRVSFRTNDRVVPHVDRRDHAVMAQLQ